MECTSVGCEKPRGYRNSANCAEHHALRDRCVVEPCDLLSRKGDTYCGKHMHLRPASAYYKICAFGPCERVALAKGYCNPHRQQQKKGQALRPLRRKHTSPICEFPDCGREVRTQGLCSAHDHQRRAGKELAPIKGHGRPKLGKPLCAYQGCEKAARSNGPRGTLCSGHLHQKRSGQELKPIHSGRTSGGHISTSGYRIIAVNNRNTPEHRAVMEKLIGRPLLRCETVHHINGDKLDNRPENLELWASRHSKGQRVEDLVDFVVNTYPELVAERLKRPLLFAA
jgi:hypothetical protein